VKGRKYRHTLSRDVKQSLDGTCSEKRRHGDLPGDDRSISTLADGFGSVGHDESTTTVTDTHTGKVVGKPYWGKPDVRFDEGAEGITDTWASTGTLHGHSEVAT
jgi:hypothetical protein